MLSDFICLRNYVLIQCFDNDTVIISVFSTIYPIVILKYTVTVIIVILKSKNELSFVKLSFSERSTNKTAVAEADLFSSTKIYGKVKKLKIYFN